MIYVKGKIIWMKSREVSFQKNGKKEAFKEHTYMICENGERPQELKSTKKIDRKVGQDVEIPAMIKNWTSKNGVHGMDLVEIGEGK